MILLYVFLLILVAIALTMVVVDNNLADHRLMGNEQYESRARWLAFAAIAYAMQELDTDASTRGELQEKSLAGGTYSARIINVDETKLRIQGWGTCGNVTIQAEKELPLAGGS
jgi:type II secretory pathway component PulK